MKINARLTLLVDGKSISIEIEDEKSARIFFRAEMSPTAFCSALGRLGYVPIEKAEVFSLDVVGKQMEVDSITFPIGDCGYGTTRIDMAKKLEKDFVPDGWVSDSYYGSQGSFPTIDGVQHATVTIRRWV